MKARWYLKRGKWDSQSEYLNLKQYSFKHDDVINTRRQSIYFSKSKLHAREYLEEIARD